MIFLTKILLLYSIFKTKYDIEILLPKIMSIVEVLNHGNFEKKTSVCWHVGRGEVKWNLHSAELWHINCRSTVNDQFAHTHMYTAALMRAPAAASIHHHLLRSWTPPDAGCWPASTHARTIDRIEPRASAGSTTLLGLGPTCRRQWCFRLSLLLQVDLQGGGDLG